MTDLQKFTAAKTANFLMWWIGIAPLYYVQRGISFEQTLFILGVFSITVVLAEYPTGVIADTYSHKKSIILGQMISALAMFLVIFPGNYFYYICVSIFLAIGSAMRSGSDLAILHTISDDFKKDLAHVNTMALLGNVVSASLGAYLFTLNIILPYILTAMSIVLSAYFYSTIKLKDTKNNEESANVYKTAIAAVKYVKKDALLMATLLLSGSFVSFFYSIKWIAPMILDSRGMNTEMLGLILSVAMLTLALGTKLSGGKYGLKVRYAVPFIIFGCLLLGVAQNIFIVVLAIMMVHFFRGFFVTNITSLVNQRSSDGVRASIFSLQSLVGRLLMSVYMFGAGFVVGILSLQWLLTLTCVALCIFSCGFLLTRALSTK